MRVLCNHETVARRVACDLATLYFVNKTSQVLNKGYICMYTGDYRIRLFLYNFNRHSKGERPNGFHFQKGERTIGSDYMKTLCIIRLYIYPITIKENNTDVLFMLLTQIKRMYRASLLTRRTCALIRHTSYRMLVQEIVRQSHHLSDFVASSYNTHL